MRRNHVAHPLMTINMHNEQEGRGSDGRLKAAALLQLS
jgi:hypothetical protein